MASKFMKMDNPRTMTDEMWAEIKSVIGSAFTQAPDRKLKGFPLKGIGGLDLLGSKNPLLSGFLMEEAKKKKGLK
ncbi:MAG: hypothetical protein EOO01_23770 [Chitinophagaceae bacterium]|nr:MAG: hypothetical protein EOO01_23770 [Chitinophagaceae bacterium]